jgi:zinc transport system substrate-binding protein
MAKRRRPHRIIPVFVGSLITLLIAAACAKSGAPAEGRLVLCSTYPVYISTKNIIEGIPGIRLERIAAQHEGCPHDHHLSPGDLKRLAGAWAFIINGAGLEAYLDKAIKHYPDVEIIDASRGFALSVMAGFGTNAHVWVAPSGTMHQVRAISEGLSALDPPNAARYRENAAAYLEKLAGLRKRMAAALEGLRGRKILTFHDAFRYFADDFGLVVAGVIQHEPEAAPSAAELAGAIRLVKAEGVSAVFAEPHAPQRAAETVAKETGLAVSLLDPVSSGPDDPDAYLRAMEKNLAVLLATLR